MQLFGGGQCSRAGCHALAKGGRGDGGGAIQGVAVGGVEIGGGHGSWEGQQGTGMRLEMEREGVAAAVEEPAGEGLAWAVVDGHPTSGRWGFMA